MENRPTSVVARTLEVLTQARKIVDAEHSEALGSAAAQDWGDKSAYLGQLIDRFSRFHIQRKVFVSYNKQTGKRYVEAIRKRMKGKYEVVTGFDPLEEGVNQTLTDVLKRLRPCPVYVGILTPEHAIVDSTKFAPASWVLDEKGMALGMDKKMVLFVDERVHEDYYQKTLPHYTHIVFEQRKYQKKIREVLAAVDQRFEELAHHHR
jgi:hypothetical protein